MNTFIGTHLQIPAISIFSWRYVLNVVVCTHRANSWVEGKCWKDFKRNMRQSASFWKEKGKITLGFATQSGANVSMNDRNNGAFLVHILPASGTGTCDHRHERCTKSFDSQRLGDCGGARRVWSLFVLQNTMKPRLHRCVLNRVLCQ